MNDSEVPCRCSTEVNGKTPRVGPSVCDLYNDGFAVLGICYTQPCSERIAAVSTGEGISMIRNTIGHFPSVEFVVVKRRDSTFGLYANAHT